MAKVSAVATTLLLLMFFILLVIQPFWSTCCVSVVVGVPAVAGIPTVDNNPSVSDVSIDSCVPAVGVP